MRNFTMIGAAALALAGLLGCGGDGDGGKKEAKYELKKVESSAGFTVFYPYFNSNIGFFHQEMDGGSVLINKGSTGDIDCAADVNECKVKKEAVDFDAYVAADLKERKKNKGFKIRSDVADKKKGGNPAKVVTYEMKSAQWASEPDPYQVEQVTYVHKGGKVYSLRTSAYRPKWDARKKYFDEMHKKFKVH
ncbi:MAG: hypothetical protein ACYTGX_03510 [Planctomycetota bacterium]|jgi:hypothetical protein